MKLVDKTLSRDPIARACANYLMYCEHGYHWSSKDVGRAEGNVINEPDFNKNYGVLYSNLFTAVDDFVGMAKKWGHPTGSWIDNEDLPF